MRSRGAVKRHAAKGGVVKGLVMVTIGGAALVLALYVGYHVLSLLIAACTWCFDSAIIGPRLLGTVVVPAAIAGNSR